MGKSSVFTTKLVNTYLRQIDTITGFRIYMLYRWIKHDEISIISKLSLS